MDLGKDGVWRDDRLPRLAYPPFFWGSERPEWRARLDPPKLPPPKNLGRNSVSRVLLWALNLRAVLFRTESNVEAPSTPKLIDHGQKSRER